MNNKGKPSLGNLIIDQSQTPHAKERCTIIQEPFFSDLLDGYTSQKEITKTELISGADVPRLTNIDPVKLSDRQIPQDVINKISAKIATYYQIIPVDYRDQVLTVAAADPLSSEIFDGISLVVPCRIKTVPANEKDIREAIRKHYGVGAETINRMMDTGLINPVVEKGAQDISEIDSEASIAKFVNQILLEAYRDRATDIHIQPFENELQIRYRVDGILYDTKLPANIGHFKESINSRIKIMSNLNIAEKRLPQDGKFKVRVGDIDLDLRVSFLPTPQGESVVIRILNSSRLYDFTELGLLPDNFQTLSELVKKPHGIIFITGPTGSGKTTTLYSCLEHVNRTDRKIITIEDPIEYQLKGPVQVQVNPGIGLTFAAGLRSMLRHDPDIMMVGEVRDLETAEIAIQVALTGHLVFSTLHTNDAASGVTRLIDMGIQPYLVASSVECFIAQRLIRRICPECKVPTEITPAILKEFGLNPQENRVLFTYEGKGCEACHFTGFHGREAIYEFLVMRDEIKELVMAQASAAQIKDKAVKLGMKTLIQDGWEKVKQGVTTAGEIIRVAKEQTE